jgi:hypothetical protein
MTDNSEIDLMRKEISVLTKEILRLHAMLKRESDSSTKHINELYQRTNKTSRSVMNHLSILYDMVAPIEEKLFPGVSRARQQLACLAEKDDPESGGAPDERNP